jgi:trans-aconitate methyltransferase
MQQTWDASLYAGNGRRPVALLADSLVEALQPKAGERILDLGCGDGFLTRRIAESGATMVGVDSSPQMIAAAKERGLDARFAKREALPSTGNLTPSFPMQRCTGCAIRMLFSNGVYRALKPGGRFVAECGGQGTSPRFA